MPLGKKYKLTLVGKGGAMHDNIENLIFHFFAYRDLTKEQLSHDCNNGRGYCQTFSSTSRNDTICE